VKTILRTVYQVCVFSFLKKNPGGLYLEYRLVSWFSVVCLEYLAIVKNIKSDGINTRKKISNTGCIYTARLQTGSDMSEKIIVSI